MDGGASLVYPHPWTLTADESELLAGFCGDGSARQIAMSMRWSSLRPVTFSSPTNEPGEIACSWLSINREAVNSPKTVPPNKVL